MRIRFNSSSITPDIIEKSWDYRELEKLFYPELDETTDRTNHFLHTLKGAVPEPNEITLLKNTLEDDLLKWRNHPFWYMLFNEKYIELHMFDELFSLMRGSVKNLVKFSEVDQTPGNREDRRPITIGTVSGLINSKDPYRALLVLTAIVRESRIKHEYEISEIAAEGTRFVFAKAVCSRPHLYICWKLLAKKCQQEIWGPFVKDDVTYTGQIDSDGLEEEITTIRRTSLKQKKRSNYKYHAFRTGFLWKVWWGDPDEVCEYEYFPPDNILNIVNSGISL